MISPPDEHGRSVGEALEWDLASFAEIDSLRRLRVLGYTAGMGTPFEWVLSLDSARDFRTDENRVWRYNRPAWRSSDIDEEPEWIRPPTRGDYREDLRRFPIVRRLRPRWLRRRLRAMRPHKRQDAPAQHADTPA